jgi:hypothetical protein
MAAVMAARAGRVRFPTRPEYGKGGYFLKPYVHRSQQIRIKGDPPNLSSKIQGGPPTLSLIALLSKIIDKYCRKLPENVQIAQKMLQFAQIMKKEPKLVQNWSKRRVWVTFGRFWYFYDQKVH